VPKGGENCAKFNTFGTKITLHFLTVGIYYTFTRENTLPKLTSCRVLQEKLLELLVTVIGSTDRDQRHAYYRMYDYCGNYGLSFPRKPVLGL